MKKNKKSKENKKTTAPEEIIEKTETLVPVKEAVSLPEASDNEKTSENEPSETKNETENDNKAEPDTQTPDDEIKPDNEPPVAENAPLSEEEKKTAVSETEGKSALKKDKKYKTGKRIYDISLVILVLFFILSFVKQIMNIELFVNGQFITNYLNCLYIIPCVLMTVGLYLSKKSAAKYKVKEKGTNTWFIIMTVITIVLTVISASEFFRPSYHVYQTEKYTASDGKEFLVAKSEHTNLLGDFHQKMPSFYDIDVYDTDGIIARKLISYPTHKGKYTIEKKSKGYRLTVSYLNFEEGIPFND